MDSKTDHLYFRQLLSGQDFATTDPFAHQMVNFTYAIGDRRTGEVVLVDPAYDIATIVSTVSGDGMTIVGTLATHYHQDHVGGAIFGQRIEGLQELLEVVDVPVHVQADEVEWVKKVTSIGGDHLVGHAGGDTVEVGGVTITLLHTPGHTPGSQCFLVDGRLVAGDTLFLDGCGRTDLPGSNVEQMYDSLQRLAVLPPDTILYPGHRYSPASSATIGAVRQSNYVFRPRTKQQFLTMFGG
jgi:hydroxyacylglutathione hydrolase